MHVQLHPLFRGVVRPDLLFALCDVPGGEDHVVVKLVVAHLALYDEVIPGSDLIQNAAVVLGAHVLGTATTSPSTVTRPESMVRVFMGTGFCLMARP